MFGDGQGASASFLPILRPTASPQRKGLPQWCSLKPRPLAHVDIHGLGGGAFCGQTLPSALLLLTVPSAGCSLMCRGPQRQVSLFLIFLLNFTHVVFLKMSPLLTLWAENDWKGCASDLAPEPSGVP